MMKSNIKENVLKAILAILIVSVIFTSGRIYELKKCENMINEIHSEYKKHYNILINEYNELITEYTEYKNNSYVLLHYGCEDEYK